MDDLNLWGVNWIDGMLVTSSHFNHQQEYSLSLGKWISAALAPGYGIIKPATLKNEPLDVQLRKDGAALVVSVLRCTALVPNGTPVNITDKFTRYKSVEIRLDAAKESRDRIPVYLYASPTEYNTFGDPLAGEQLSRLPYSTPKVTLSLGPSNDLHSSCGFQVAELVRDGGEFKLDENFVAPVLSTSCGKAVTARMERLKKIIDTMQRNGVAAIAEVRAKTKARPSAAEEETIRGIFLQSETLLHYLGYNYNRIFDTTIGVNARELITYFTGLVGGFQQGFLVYPELREYVRGAQIGAETSPKSGADVLPELRDYQLRDYGFDQLTLFFDDTERQLNYLADILGYYAKGKSGPTGDSLKLGEYLYLLQRHGAVKYSMRNGRHHIIVDGVDPRGTEDVVVRLDKKVLPLQYAGNIIIYLGANEVDDIAAASVARKPVEDVTNPDFWLIQPNEYFPLKCSRLDRLNIIIDGEVDRSALESVKMNHISIFSRSR